MNTEKPKGFKKNIENIWYHYKYVILVALAGLIMLAFAMSQQISKKSPDVFVFHISQRGLTASSVDDFRESMKLIAKDYNKDGVITVDLKQEVYVPDIKNGGVMQNELTSGERFNLELALGDCVVYLMDESFYKGNKTYMREIFDVLGFTPDGADTHGIKLSELPAYKLLPGLADLSPDLYLCLRERRSGMNEDEYLAHEDFFKRLVEYKG